MKLRGTSMKIIDYDGNVVEENVEYEEDEYDEDDLDMSWNVSG